MFDIVNKNLIIAWKNLYRGSKSDRQGVSIDAQNRFWLVVDTLKTN